MDLLFQNISSSKKNKRTTYKKHSEFINENFDHEYTHDVATDDLQHLANGTFGFVNQTVKKVKQRFDNNYQNNNKHNGGELRISASDRNLSPKVELHDSSQIQFLKNMYSGGEDLELLEATQQDAKRKNEQERQNRKSRRSKRQKKLENKRNFNSTQISYQKPKRHTRKSGYILKDKQPLNFKDITYDNQDCDKDRSEGFIQFSQKIGQSNKLLNSEECKKDTVNKNSFSEAYVSQQHINLNINTDIEGLTQIIQTNSQNNSTSEQCKQMTADSKTPLTQPTQQLASEIEQLNQTTQDNQMRENLNGPLQQTQISVAQKAFDLFKKGEHPSSDSDISFGHPICVTKNSNKTDSSIVIPLFENEIEKYNNKPPLKSQQVDFQDIIDSEPEIEYSHKSSNCNGSFAHNKINTCTTQKDFTATLKDDSGTQSDTSLQVTVPNSFTISQKKQSKSSDQIAHVAPTTLTSEVKHSSKFSKESFFLEFDCLSDNELGAAVLDAHDMGNEKSTSSDIKLEDSQIPMLNSKSSKMNLNGLSAYETTLKTKMDAESKIILDSDGELNDNESIELDKTPMTQISKAILLTIKARASKANNLIRKGSSEAKFDSKNLFNKLKRRNRQQIIKYQSEIIKRSGMNKEDLEREKEFVENLLDQELKRNMRLKKRETKQFLKMKSGSNFNSGANEFDDSDISFSGSDTEKEMKNQWTDSKQNKVLSNVSKVEHIEDEDDDKIILTKRFERSRHRQPPNNLDSDSDSIEEKSNFMHASVNGHMSKKIIPIDLGNYDNNVRNIKESDDDPNDAGVINKIEGSVFEIVRDHEIGPVEFDENNQKLKQQKLDKNRDEIKGNTVFKFFDDEAAESDDEWHGIGGVDVDSFDEYDSEIERMIDDYSRTDMNPENIRKMLAEENKELDIQMINQILYDLKNGNFRNRGKSSLDLVLSDEDDEELRKYRIKRNEIMKRKLLDIGDNEKLIKNPKSKAFFDSLIEDIADLKNPFGQVEPLIESKAPGKSETILSSSQMGDLQQKKSVLSKDFVHKTLSFLHSSRDLGGDTREVEVSEIQDDEDIDDLITLKRHSSIKAFTSLDEKHEVPDLESSTNNDANTKLYDNNEFRTEKKSASALKLGASNAAANEKFRDGSKAVKISKSYRAVGGSKTSITYMGKIRKLIPPQRKKKEQLSFQKIKTILPLSSKKHSLFNNSDNPLNQ